MRVYGGVGGNDHCRVTRCGERLSVIGLPSPSSVFLVAVELLPQTLEPGSLLPATPLLLFAENKECAVVSLNLLYLIERLSDSPTDEYII